MIPLHQFFDFSMYVPESIKEKKHVNNSSTNANNTLKTYKMSIILVSIHPLSTKRNPTWK